MEDRGEQAMFLTSRSRRVAAGGLVGGLAALLGLAGPDEAPAKKRRKRRRRSCPSPTLPADPTPATCVQQCTIQQGACVTACAANCQNACEMNNVNCLTCVNACIETCNAASEQCLQQCAFTESE